MSLAKELWGAMTEYHKMRAAGLSRIDAVKGLETVLRALWPLPPTKFEPRCQNCEDTGYSQRLCWDQERCGRKFCANHAEYEHPYVEPCFCLSGERHKARTASAADVAASLGKVSKPKRGFSRMGS